MARTKKHTKTKARNKNTATKTKTTSAVKAKGVRAQASRRTAEGKFTKIVFTKSAGRIAAASRR